MTIVPDRVKPIWKLIIEGPEGTPYADGTFDVELTFDASNLNNRVPQVKFVTKIHHPNVDKETGIFTSRSLAQNNWDDSRDARFVIEEILIQLKNPRIPSDQLREWITKTRDHTRENARKSY